MIAKENIVVAKNATEAFDQWYEILKAQHEAGFKQESRAGAVVGEIINAITIIEDPTRGICNSKIRNMPMRYAWGELLWYLSGSNRLSDIQKFTPNWDGLTDNGVTLNSAYGYRIFNQFGFDQLNHVANLLRKDANSRQAVIHIKDASDTPTKDTPCTIALQYHLREGKLHATTIMRSNDIWLGFPYDVFAFTSLQILLSMILGVEVGEYTHIAGSLHLYERNVIADGLKQTK